MKYAFLLLCHKNPEQINLLIEKLKKFNCDIFVHIDKKNYEISDKIMSSKNVHIINKNDSFNISWGGIDMINATLKLISTALSYSKQNNVYFDYFWLLSGQDYIITNPKNIESQMIKDKTLNYIEIISDNDIKYNRYKKLYELYYPSWITLNKTIIKITKRFYMLITGGFKHTFCIFKRKSPMGYKFYFGSQWWCLNYNCISYIYQFCYDNPNYLEYYRSTIIPDESFFQTIIMNSKFYNSVKNNLTFVNWKNNRRSPDNITKDDINLLSSINNHFYFARKFDIAVDDEIIKIIDKNLL